MGNLFDNYFGKLPERRNHLASADEKKALVVNPKTNSVSFFGILMALYETELETGPALWTTTNEDQAFFLSKLRENRLKIQDWAKIPGVKTKATDNPAVMKQFLTENGFQVNIDDTCLNSLYIAVLTRFMKKWDYKADLTTFKLPGEDAVYFASSFDSKCSFGYGATAIILNDGSTGLVIHLAVNGPNDAKFAVVVASAKKEVYTHAELVQEGIGFANDLIDPKVDDSVDIVSMPCLEFSSEEKLSYLEGLSYGDHAVRGATFVMKAKIDNVGYESQSVTLVMVGRGGAIYNPKELWITNPIIALINLGTQSNPSYDVIEVIHGGKNSWIQRGLGDECLASNPDYVNAVNAIPQLVG